MSLINYEIFEAVVKHQSFLRASEILKLSPSAISHSISKLEDTIGFPLFIRGKTGAQLTNSGAELLPYIRTILNDVENLNQRIAQLNGLEKGSVRIGTINSVCVSWLPDIIRSFAKLYPGIELNIFQGGYDDVVSWLHSNTVDIRVYFHIPRRFSPGNSRLQRPVAVHRTKRISTATFRLYH